MKSAHQVAGPLDEVSQSPIVNNSTLILCSTQQVIMDFSKFMKQRISGAGD